VARVVDRRGAYRVLMRRPERKRPLGIPGHKLDAYIKVDIQEVEWGHGLN